MNKDINYFIVVILHILLIKLIHQAINAWLYDLIRPLQKI